VPSATDSPGTPQPPAIQRFAGYRSHRPAGHSTRGCAGGAYTEGLTPHVRLVTQQHRPLAFGPVSSPANGQRQLAGVTVPSATDSPGTPQPPAIQRFAGYRSHRPAGHSTRGCAGGADTEGLTPHVRLVDAPRTPGLDLVGANAMIWRTPVAPQGGSSLWASKRPNFRAPSPLYRATNLSNHAVAWGCHTPSTWIGIGC